MENSTATNSNSAPQNTDQKTAVVKDICAKWSKFSEQDVAAIKGKSDLVSKVVSNYGLPQSQAQSEVDALLKGRQIGAGA
jgi:hypothetical protein